MPPNPNRMKKPKLTLREKLAVLTALELVLAGEDAWGGDGTREAVSSAKEKLQATWDRAAPAS